ncbi:MAG TPA: hypothetical protein PKW82_11940 [Spirochaetales bacterium]|nr:hypothetical protein [Spirochaetales bacterium]
MATCECLPRCPFFNNRMASMPAMSTLMKKRYCQWDNSGCARYFVFSKAGPAKVPADLFPNQLDRAKAIVESTPRG